MPPALLVHPTDNTPRDLSISHGLRQGADLPVACIHGDASARGMDDVRDALIKLLKHQGKHRGRQRHHLRGGGGCRTGGAWARHRKWRRRRRRRREGFSAARRGGQPEPTVNELDELER